MPDKDKKRTGQFGTMCSADVTPCDPDAKAFAEALVALMDAQRKLEKAKKNVPDYLPTCTPEDIVAEEQDEWNCAATALWRAAHDTAKARRDAARVLGGIGCYEP